MKNKNIEFELDWKKTLSYNSFWIISFIVVTIISIITLGKIDYFADEGFRVMFLIFAMFFILKLFAWVGYPQIHEKPNHTIEKEVEEK